MVCLLVVALRRAPVARHALMLTGYTAGYDETVLLSRRADLGATGLICFHRLQTHIRRACVQPVRA
jgi:hypothetical protein